MLHPAIALLLACAIAVFSGCQSCSRDESRDAAPGAGDIRERHLSWTFDGERIVSDDGRTLLVGPLMNVSWAAVTDSDSQKTAWLPTPETEKVPPQEIVEGHQWVREGIINGPGIEISETLADKQLIRYRWEAIRRDEHSLRVTYTAELIDHVIFASFSNFMIALPLSPFLGAKATVNETHGGVIPERFHGGPSHPSYWEGPARSIRLKGKDVTLELALSEGGFTWASLVEGRALASRDTLLLIRLFPAVAGPREKLGTLAWRGTEYSASFTINLMPSPAESPAPAFQSEVTTLDPPAALPPAVTASFDPSAWELEPFAVSAEEAADTTLSIGNKALWCDLALQNETYKWNLEVGGYGTPQPAFVYLKGPVEDFALKINGMGDFRDSRDLLNQLEPLPPDPAARAEKIWRYATGVTYAMPLHPTDDLGEFLGSYGYGISSTLSALALVRLWESAGLPTRRAFVSGTEGHATLGEVYYDGDWHAYDLHERTFYVDPADWSAASAAELAGSPDLVRFNIDADGLSPSGAIAEDLVRIKYEGAEISYNPGSFSFQRLLRTSLRKGETFVRFYRSLGRWAPAPREPDYYANALLAFCPDLNDEKALEGFSKTNNFVIRDGALVPESKTQPAWFEYRAACPYVIVESTMKIACEPSAPEGATLMISKDEGTTWIPASLDEGSGLADLTDLLVPGQQERGAAYEKLERNFSYLVHFELPPSSEETSVRIDDLAVLTWSQVDAALLPRLGLGSNDLEAKCAAWGPGASLGLAWVETEIGIEPDRPFKGEPFYLNGYVLNRGTAPAGDFTVTAYAHGASGRVELGRWRPEDPLDPGAKDSYTISCDAPDLKTLYPESQPRRLNTTVEIRPGGEPSRPTAWEARSKPDIGLRQRPDLVVVPGLVKFSPNPPAPGQQVEIGVMVRNFWSAREFLFPEGTAVTSADVALYEIEGESRRLVQQVSLEEILPGGGALALFRWTAPSTPGVKRLLIVADPDEKITERDERNSAVVEVAVG